MYYQQLKQVVGDKTHFHAYGPVQILTRQPVVGRNRHEGGDGCLSDATV